MMIFRSKTIISTDVKMTNASDLIAGIFHFYDNNM